MSKNYRLGFRTCLCASLLLATGAAAADPYVAGKDRFFDQVVTQIGAVTLAGVNSELRLEGISVGKLFTGSGEYATLSLNLAADKNYVIASACDEDCRRLGLGLFDTAGRRIDTGHIVDGISLIEFRPPRAGRYEARVVIPSCMERKCSYGLGLLGEIPRLGTAELSGLVAKGARGGFQLVDARPRAAFERGHLPGAVSVPADELERGIARLPTDNERPLIIYCVNPDCHLRKQVTVAATLAGYSNLFVYPEGIEGWTKAGLPLVGADETQGASAASAQVHAISPSGVIGTEKLLEVIDRRHGDYLLIDVRTAADYREGHISGAISLPLTEITGLSPVSGAEAERLVIFYCWYEECGLSTEATARARAAGYRNVVAYVGGVKGWVAAGLRLVREGPDHEQAPTAEAPAATDGQTRWRSI